VRGQEALAVIRFLTPRGPDRFQRMRELGRYEIVRHAIEFREIDPELLNR
jgi:hypothetical protein